MDMAEPAKLWPVAEPRPISIVEDFSSPAFFGSHSSWVYRQPAIAVVTGGYFGYRTETGEGRGVPGTVIAGAAGQAFDVEHLEPGGNRRLVLFLDEALLREVAEQDDLSSCTFPVSVVSPSRESAGVAGCLRSLSGHQPLDAGSIYLLVSKLLGWGSAVPLERPLSLKREARLRPAVRYLENHFDEPCTLGDLANVCGLTRYHFLRGFRQLVGLTPTQYLLHLRLDAAARQLSETDKSVLAIAFDVGFNDLSHFYKMFTDRFGQAPGRWRTMN